MLPFLGIMCVLLGLVLCVYYFILICRRNRNSEGSLCIEESYAFEIVRLVEALREICPPGSGRGWTLLPTASVSRCWRRLLPFEFLSTKINIYASSILVEASATAVLNVVADIYTWSDWGPPTQQRHLEAEISDDPDLHGDRYMQCDQVITKKGLPEQDNKAGILIHRFGNLEANGVSWILTWHIRQLDWCFYLSQPIDEPNSSPSKGDSGRQCLLTLVRGVSPFLKLKENIPVQLACCLSHLKQALSTSNLQVRPFLPILPLPRCSLDNPHLPTIRSALYDTTDVPCVLLRHSKESGSDKDSKSKNHLLAVVPFAMKKPVTLRNLKGFILVPWPNKSGSGEGRTREGNGGNDRVRRRALRPQLLALQENGDVPLLPFPPPCASLPSFPSSSSSSSPATDNKTSKDFQRSSSFFGSLFRRRRSSSSLHRRLSDNSSNDGGFTSGASSSGRHKTIKRRGSNSALLVSLLAKTVSSIDGLILPVEAESFSRENTLKENLGVEVNDLEPNNNQSEMNVTLLTRSDAEPSQIDYASVGRECVARVLMEVRQASTIDLSVPPYLQKSSTGGWVCEGIHKDVLVLMKLSNVGPVKTVSYLSKGVIPAAPDAVWKTICNPLTKYMYDETCKRVTVIEELTKEQSIVYTLHESVSLLKKEVQDFCILCTQRLEGAHSILSLHSVEHNSCPNSKDATRGTLLPSGWIVEPYPDNNGRSVVTYLIQLTVKTCDSLLIEEMGTTQCISKLRRYFGSRISS